MHPTAHATPNVCTSCSSFRPRLSLPTYSGCAQVLLVHVKDLQLALLVTRLIEVRDAAPGTSTAVTGSRFGGGGLLGRGGLGGGFGAGRGFGGGFGGGGWGDGDEEPAPDANAAYASLGRASRKLIRAELLPMFDGENYESNSLRG